MSTAPTANPGPLPVATRMRILPCDLAEGELVRTVGDAFFLRTLRVDLSAGTVQVTIEPWRVGVIFWRIPAVPLDDLAPLVRAVRPLIEQALPGVSLPFGTTEHRLRMTADAQRALQHAADLVNLFWLRWSGRGLPARHFAHCAHCHQLIIAPAPPLSPVWQTERGPDGYMDLYCPNGAPSEQNPRGMPHQPGPDGHPDGIHVDFRPEHHPTYTQARDGTCSGACSCGRWVETSTDPARRDLLIGWTLHAGRLPPGAPFDVEGAPR